LVTDENGLFDAWGRDLTLTQLSNRVIDLPLSQGRGYGVESFSEVMESWVAWLIENFYGGD